MKKSILILAMAIIATTLMGANEKYYQKMGQTLGQFNTCNSVECLQNLANQFKVIANVENEEWLPLYYEAQCYIMISFKNGSGAEQKDGYLDQARVSLDKMLIMAPEETEAHALFALYHTARLVINPADRAMNTQPLVGAAIGKALKLDPLNPRAKYIQLSNEIGTANFFGQDTAPFCKSASELLEQWDSYQLKSPIHPSWGKGMVQEIVSSCSK